MNLILVDPGEIDQQGYLNLRGEYLKHLREVLGTQVGDTLRVGELNGRIGEGEVLALDSDRAQLRVTLDREAPEPLAVTIVLALPRPKMLRRLLRGIAELGVKDLHLINSYRVEKSYWQSPLLAPKNLERYLRAGLEQAIDTCVPAITLHRRFRPFAEDHLPQLCKGRHALLAAPEATEAYPAVPQEPALAIIGPEGGFIPFETELLTAAGARAVNLGSRVLRVETALQAALGRHLATAAQT